MWWTNSLCTSANDDLWHFCRVRPSHIFNFLPQLLLKCSEVCWCDHVFSVFCWSRCCCCCCYRSVALGLGVRERSHSWRRAPTLRYHVRCNSVLWQTLRQRECVGRMVKCSTRATNENRNKWEERRKEEREREKPEETGWGEREWESSNVHQRFSEHRRTHWGKDWGDCDGCQTLRGKAVSHQVSLARRKFVQNAADEHDIRLCPGSWRMLFTWLQTRGHLRVAPDTDGTMVWTVYEAGMAQIFQQIIKAIHIAVTEKQRTRGSLHFEFYQRDVTDGTRPPLNVPLTRSQRSFTNGHYCGENWERREACFLKSFAGFFSSSIEDIDLMRCSLLFLNDLCQLEAHAMNFAVTDYDGFIDTKLSSIEIHTARSSQGGKVAVVYRDAVVKKREQNWMGNCVAHTSVGDRGVRRECAQWILTSSSLELQFWLSW